MEWKCDQREGATASVYSLNVRNVDLSKNIFAGELSQFARRLVQMKAAGTKVTVDDYDDVELSWSRESEDA